MLENRSHCGDKFQIQKLPKNFCETKKYREKIMKKTISVAAIILLAVFLCCTFVGCKSMMSFSVITVDFDLFVPPFLSMTPNFDGKNVVYETKTTTYVGSEVIKTENKKATAENPLTWMPDQNHLDKQQKAVVEVMIVSEKQYVGYMVISIKSSARKGNDLDISYKVVKEQKFRQRDGQMTKEQVQKLIDEAVKKA